LVQYVIIKKFLLAVFFILMVLAVCSVVILHMPGIAIALLLIDFIVAGFVAISASLRLREEEEEKLFK